ncbi:IbrB-like domain-containing protein [Streptomyces pinistramenti]|uniref:IbrB-like domain-containing protein n=1 Tax=Streptomyces pinistramenti TaxID=2884812 RepID=UPI001D098978|nr:ParB/RepB/Spo0J family partition protein [Streptomyces pinistramenti]MCB5910341.1 ParB/RepB/Spo0J family partition protein [Streptomyces pinistramenti]
MTTGDPTAPTLDDALGEPAPAPPGTSPATAQSDSTAPVDGTVPAEAAGILADARALFARLDALDEDTRIDTVNALRLALHEHSPLRDQPVDCVLWVEADQVGGNAYNPNVVAGPEMDLLKLSIGADGYTQPVVAWKTSGDQNYEVVDGFHRHRVGKEDEAVRAAVRGRLPVTVVNTDRTGKADRMAATIRHNRARGQHTVDGMSEIVLELARLRKPDTWIGEHLGMDPDEVTRLRQVTGIAELLADEEFSEAWEVNDAWDRPDTEEENVQP